MHEMLGELKYLKLKEGYSSDSLRINVQNNCHFESQLQQPNGLFVISY